MGKICWITNFMEDIEEGHTDQVKGVNECSMKGIVGGFGICIH
jgi:hypothetical protein